MKVSVVISSYNGENYIEECIKSILEQTFTDFEIIIVDDQSNDKTANIVERLMHKDSRISLYINPIHNHSAALNYGLSIAKGDYIARIDQDDVMELNRLERQVNYMEATTDCDICASWFRTFGSLNKDYNGHFGRIINSKELFLLGNLIANPTSMIKTSFIRKRNIYYSQKYHYAEDYAMWVECALAEANFDVIPEILMSYRIHDKQASQIHFEEQDCEALEIRTNLLNHFIKCDMFSPKQRKIIEELSELNNENLVSPETVLSLSYEILRNKQL